MAQRAEAHTTHAAHVEHGFVRTYIFSTDHKMIGRQYLFYGLLMMILWGILALLVRWQLAWPESAVPGLGWVPEPFMYGGIIPPEDAAQLLDAGESVGLDRAELAARAA